MKTIDSPKFAHQPSRRGVAIARITPSLPGAPFAELKQRSLINERARAADDDPNFSRPIREGLPEGK
jgi:hypothetical protein